jgi:hypothetical protein
MMKLWRWSDTLWATLIRLMITTALFVMWHFFLQSVCCCADFSPIFKDSFLCFTFFLSCSWRQQNVYLILHCNSPWSLNNCPPYHIDTKGTKIHRTDKKRFPYSAYHLYCSPPNAAHAVAPLDVCDPYSNPQPQELVQLLPHPEWAVHGYPSKKGEGWVGDPRTWVLDVGALSNRLYFYQVNLPKP